ncbi:hypothetical protein ACET3Z_005332 [Daucus carota]
MSWILATNKLPTCIVAEAAFDTYFDTVFNEVVEDPALKVLKRFNNLVHFTPIQVVQDHVNSLCRLERKPNLNKEEKINESIFLEERAYFEKKFYVEQNQGGIRFNGFSHVWLSLLDLGMLFCGGGLSLTCSIKSMEYPTFVPDFFKYITPDDCATNELLLPRKFCEMQQHILRENCILTIRNGYKMHVAYDRKTRKLRELGDLFNDFELGGGEVLIFELVDGNNFNVYIVGEDGNEINYPAILHTSQTSSSSAVTNNSSGWKFVKFISNAHPTDDEILLPKAFMRMFGSKLPEWFCFVLKNHFRFGGHLDFLEGKITGLRKVCGGLKLANFQKLELLVFTYEMGRSLNLSLFDGHNVEVSLDVQAITYGSLFLTFRYPCHFKIEVMPSHMLKYCPGVTIPVEFKFLTDQWKKRDKITVCKGRLQWELEIRKARKGNRITINGGFIALRTDMQLDVGDCCFFRWINESYHHFRLEIVKGG